MVFTPSVLPVPHSFRAPEWRVLVVAFRKQLLTSHFPHPAPITVIISTVTQSARRTPPVPLSHPSVAWRAALIDGSAVPVRWREAEGGGSSKRKLFSTSTGKKSSEAAGERNHYCCSLLVFFWGIHMIWMRSTELWKEKAVVCCQGVSAEVNS